MKNVTIALAEKTLRDARRIAAERSTTLNALIREYTEDLNHGQSYGAVRPSSPTSSRTSAGAS